MQCFQGTLMRESLSGDHRKCLKHLEEKVGFQQNESKADLKDKEPCEPNISKTRL